MKRFGAAVLSLLAGALGACSDSDAPAEAPAVDAQPESAAKPVQTESGGGTASPARPATTTPFGGGRTLSGSVSGLTGRVTAFQVEVTDTATVVQIAADVLFAFDSAELGPQAPEQLRRAADLIRQGAPGDIPVVGHTDAKGTDAYNDDLSRRRAEAVAVWLATQGGVAPERLKPEGRGEREPIAPNLTSAGQDDPAGRARNRRVVLIIPRKAG